MAGRWRSTPTRRACSRPRSRSREIKKLPLPRDQREALATDTDWPRAAAQLGIVWIAAHSPQAKGRVEPAVSRLPRTGWSRGCVLAGAKTLEQANRYLQEEFVPWWNQHLKRRSPGTPPGCSSSAGARAPIWMRSLSVVETRQVTQDYTIRFESAIYQIGREDIRARLRGANACVWRVRLDSSLRVRFQDRYLAVSRCQQPPKLIVAVSTQRKSSSPPGPVPRLGGRVRTNSSLPSAIPLWKAARIDRTRTSDSLEEGSRVRRAKPARRSSRLKMQSLRSEVSPAAERVPNRKAPPREQCRLTRHI